MEKYSFISGIIFVLVGISIYFLLDFLGMSKYPPSGYPVALSLAIGGLNIIVGLILSPISERGENHANG